MRRSLLPLGLALAGCAHPSPVAPPIAPPAAPVAVGLEPPQPTLRLARNFLPTGYAARLELDPAATGFAGSIAITGWVATPSSVIWLHGHKLKVRSASAARGAATVAVIVTPRGDELLELRAERPLEVGAWTLTIDYTGEFDLVATAGAFKQVVDGDAYVYSQLGSIYARRVFPCFDEPDNKVPWELTLDVPAALVAVSNSPIARETPLDGGRRRVQFERTRPLPTYLIAFGVGPFEIVDGGRTAGGTPVRILTLARRAAEGAFAAKTTARLLELTEAWIGMPYPYAKLDMLTIPLTIGFGAMENAGLVTFSEIILLLDPVRASRHRQNRWIIVGSHEIAHQWFGDLVTFAYWEDAWLSEGFANWMETKTAAAFDPALHDEGDALDQRDAALAEDALVTARQVRQPITGADDIQNAFDSITYNKGASLLRMFEAYVGPDVFRKGIRDYLAARAHGNVTAADFVAAISKAAGRDLAPAFASFLDRPGAPQLTMDLACGGSQLVSLAQRRFVPVGAPAVAAAAPWILPVCLAYDHDGARRQTCVELDGDRRVALNQDRCPRWVMPNVEGLGYYRVAYTPAQAVALRDLAWPLLSWNERRAIFSDVVAASGQGQLPLALALSFVPRMLAGGDRYTVSPAIDLPASFERWIPADQRPRYERWMRATFGKAARAAGFLPRPGESIDVEATRKSALLAVAWTGRDPRLVAQAVRLAATWRELPQSLRGLVLALAVDASPTVFAKILRDVRTEPDRTRRREMYAALGGVRDLRRQGAALALILDPALDVRETIEMVWPTSTEETTLAAGQFFVDHVAEILPRLPRDATTSSLGDYATLLTAACRADRRDAIREFATRELAPLPGGARAVAKALEGLDQCTASRAASEPQLRAWLRGI